MSSSRSATTWIGPTVLGTRRSFRISSTPTWLLFESGEILEQYPSAKNRPVAFRVVFQVPPDESGRAFVARVSCEQSSLVARQIEHWPVILAYGDLCHLEAHSSSLADHRGLTRGHSCTDTGCYQTSQESHPRQITMVAWRWDCSETDSRAKRMK